jgi:hypothetical protein
MREKSKGVDGSDSMSIDKYVINPKVGFGFLKFGMSFKDVENQLGPPEEVDDSDEYESILYSYEKKGISFLSFDKDENFRLVTIELNNKSNAILWDTRIFDQTFEKLKKLSAKMGYSLEFEDSVKDNDTGEVFEESYKIDSLYISFYFNEFKILEEICLGVGFNENDEIVWPE